MCTRRATKQTLDQQLDLIKELGYAGTCWTCGDPLPLGPVVDGLKKRGLKLFAHYAGATLRNVDGVVGLSHFLAGLDADEPGREHQYVLSRSRVSLVEVRLLVGLGDQRVELLARVVGVVRGHAGGVDGLQGVLRRAVAQHPAQTVRPGDLLLVFFVWYGTTRLILESLRVDRCDALFFTGNRAQIEQAIGALQESRASLDALKAKYGDADPYWPPLIRSVFYPDVDKLIERLRNRCDVIIVDSAPLAAGSDALVLGAATGSLLLVFRAGATDVRLASAKVGMLENLPIRVVGAVLNDVRSSDWHRDYAVGLPGYGLPPGDPGDWEPERWTPHLVGVS